MYYKNVSCFAKTFYGVEFKPGEAKEVPGYVNDKHMIVVDELQKPAKPAAPKKDAAKPSEKSEAPKEDKEPKLTSTNTDKEK